MSENVLPEGLSRRLSAMYPGATVRAVKVLGVDEHPEDESAKELGYGRPIRVTLATVDDAERSIVFHTAAPNDFGHDRPSDRAQERLLTYDTFAESLRTCARWTWEPSATTARSSASIAHTNST